MKFQIRSLEEAELVFRCQDDRIETLQQHVRLMQKQLDTLGSPWWKRMWFRLNGWPPWWNVVKKPTHRFWHRWTGV